MEQWKDIAGYDGRYQVSDQGRVRSYKRSAVRILKQNPTTSNKMTVTLCNQGVMSRPMVHILVLEAFVGPRPEGLLGCHFDDDPNNNQLANLRWDTLGANQRDAVRNGRHHQAKKTHCPAGHEYSEENTRMVLSRGHLCRRCLTCSRKSDRERKARLS